MITGPRQSGKTTFLRTELGEAYHYVSFDAPVEREFALQDPNGFLDRFTGRPVILDEIQYLPELLPYLKIRIDRQRSEYGRWVLTGSRQFSLMQNVSESLAGRIALLYASYIGWFLPPYFQNYNKRTIRSPKFYFIDSGLVCALTRQPDAHAALAGQMGGALFEGMVVTEAVKTFVNRGQRPDLYFWRSHDGLEVDLVIRVNGRLLPVEIKFTATPSSGFLAPLDKFKAMAGKDASDTGVLVCRTETIQQMPHGNLALPWQQFPAWLDELLSRSWKLAFFNPAQLYGDSDLITTHFVIDGWAIQTFYRSSHYKQENEN